MINQYYKAVAIDESGNSTEAVNYVGVYTLNWEKSFGKPEMGFTETNIDIYELREILNDINYNIETNLQRGNDTTDITYLKNIWNRLSDFITKIENG
jgi:hypothetical protein